MAQRGKKEKIEQAAIKLFALKGPAGTTIKDIAENSGVTEGALYRHYKSKEAMATELFMREQAKIRAALITIFERDLPFPAKLREVISCIYHRYATEPCSTLFVLLNFQHMQGINMPGFTRDIYDFFLERTAAMMSDLPAKPDEITTMLLLGLIMEPMLFHHHGKLPQQPAAYLNEVAAACCRVLNVPTGRQSCVDWP